MSGFRRFLFPAIIAAGLSLMPIVASAATSPPGTYYVTERFNQGIAKVTVDSSGHATVNANFVTGLPQYGPDSVVFDHHGKMLVSNPEDQSISRVDPSNGQIVTRKINLVSIPLVADLALHPTQDTVWAIQWSGDTLAKVDLTTGATVLFHSAETSTSNLGGLTFSPDGRLFVSSHIGSIAEINPLTGQKMRNVIIDGKSPDGMTFDPSTGHIFSSGCNNAICEFDIGTASDPKLSLLKVHTGIDGDGIAADGKGNILIVNGDGLSSLALATDTHVLMANGIPSPDDVAPVVGAGAAPPAAISLSPVTATHTVGQTTTATATLTDANNNPVSGATVTLTVTGANPRTLSATSNTQGQATFSYPGSNAGTDSLVASSGGVESNHVTVVWVATVTVTATSPPVLAQTGQSSSEPMILWLAGGILLICGALVLGRRRRA